MDWIHQFGTLYSYIGEDEEVVIPDSLDGIYINEIRNNCFTGSNVSRIIFNASSFYSTSNFYIDGGAFAGLQNLTLEFRDILRDYRI